jgi:serine/threonine-protein kinase HipA
LYGDRIATLSEPQYGKLRLTFATDAEERFRPGSPVLSISMPVDAARRPRGDIVRAFFDGLLPEGQSRAAISREFGVHPGDDFGLLTAIGRDCAGAVVLLPEDVPPPSPAGEVELLADGELATLIAQLRDRPLGADNKVRVSLPGMQEKLLLAKTPDGRWGRPVNGTPSTHILKPQDMRYASYAASEAFCLALSRRLGLGAFSSEVIEVAGRPVIVVERYDRARTERGVERIHQEDVCQALGIDTSDRPARKYQASGGPSLRDVASLLARYQPEDNVRLLRLVTLNVAIGNADCHAKNVSLLHPVDETVHLAPAYDLTPTTFYTGIPTEAGPKDMSDELAMFVNGTRSIHEVTSEDLADEGSSWGLGADAGRTVGAALTSILDCLEDAAHERPVPSEMLRFVASRTTSLLAGRPPGPPAASD